ncbi:MAG: hypothetical protein ACLFUG_08445 [Nitriliruptoraceae bacterium]
MALSALVLVLVGCSRFGEATIRIDEAEAELAGLVDEVVAITGLEVTSEEPFGARERCELVTTGTGASSRSSVRGPVPDTPDVLERAAAVLTEAGYVLVPSEEPEEVFGRRDGLRLTVAIDRGTDELAIDANTACRPLPG